MPEILHMINKIKESQATIDTLLKDGLVAVKNGHSPLVWAIEEVYQGKECNFGFAHSDSDGDRAFPYHAHKESLEYLICVQGKILLTIENIVTRVMNVGDCASIPVGSVHSTSPLEPDSKLFYICIPTDTAFPKLVAKNEG